MLGKLLTWLGGAILIAIMPILYFTTINAGKKVFLELSVEFEICVNSASCSDAEKDILADMIMDDTDYSSMRQIEWCLGIDTWADTRVRRGGWLIGFMMDGGYLFCPVSSQ